MSNHYFTLRDDQTRLVEGFNAIPSGNVLLVAPTGFGKTVVMSHLAAATNKPAVAIAHRHELVSQISRAIARAGVMHNIIASKNTVSHCISTHVRDFGRSFHSPKASFTVAGVDTLIARGDSLRQWANTVEQWTIDEAHHVLSGNKWGRATLMFPRARGVGFTATPLRADRKSLGSAQGGVFDHMVVGPTMRELINQGSLCEYRIFAPPMSIDRSAIEVGSTGDFKAGSMRQEVHRSQIVGDAIRHYDSLIPGRKAIAFCVDVEHAMEMAEAFREFRCPRRMRQREDPRLGS